MGQAPGYDTGSFKRKRRRQIMLQVRTYCASWAIVVVGVSIMLHVLGVA